METLARPDFTPTEQNQLHKLIDSLFKEENEKPTNQNIQNSVSANQNPPNSLSTKSTNQTIVTYAQSPNLNRSLSKPEVQGQNPSRSLPVLHSRPTTASAQNNPTQISPSNQIRPLPTLQNMSKQPLPAQPQTSTTPITTPLPTNQNAVQQNKSPKEKTPILR